MREINPNLKRAKFGTYENDLILNRSAQTRDLVNVWMVKWHIDTKDVANKFFDASKEVSKRNPRKIPDTRWRMYIDRDDGFVTRTRLLNMLPLKAIKVDKKVVVPINTGEKLEVSAEYRFYSLGEAPPIMIVDFLENKPPKDEEDKFKYAEACEKCAKLLREGMDYKVPGTGEVIHYEYCLSSTAELRVLKGLFVRSDLPHDEKYLALFEDKEYVEKLRALRGAEVIYNMVSYGGYLRYLKGKPYSLSKFITRMGLCQSSTKDLGTISFRRIGRVKIKFSDAIRNYLIEAMEKMGLSPFEISRNIQDIASTWKEDKFDGCSLISAQKLSRMLKKIGLNKTPEELIGKLVQYRLAFAKGTALAVDENELWKIKDAYGIPVYNKFELIIEENSWKLDYDPEHFNGKLAPHFELVALSRSKFTHSSNYQWLNALDGSLYGYPERSIDELDELFLPNACTFGSGADDTMYDNPLHDTSLRDALLNPCLDNHGVLKTGYDEYVRNVRDETISINNFKKLIDKTLDTYEEATTDPLKAQALLGIKSSSITDKVIIDDSQQNMNTVISKALDACPDIIFDASCRKKLYGKMITQYMKVSAGRIPLEGANRYIISDPTPMLRMDLAVKNGEVDHNGLDMYDIIIDHPSQCAIRDPYGCYWNGMSGPAVLFRAPCVHPGEPQLVNLLDIEDIPDNVNDISTKALFSQIEDVVIVNVFNSILSAMGGADIDGDTVLVCTQPEIVQLRNVHRKTPLVDIISEEKAPSIIPPESVREYFFNSLK